VRIRDRHGTDNAEVSVTHPATSSLNSYRCFRRGMPHARERTSTSRDCSRAWAGLDALPEVVEGGYCRKVFARGIAPSAAAALGHTFLIMLVTRVIAAVLILCVARRTYPPDVETAMAAELLSVGAAAPERTAQKTGTDPNVLQHQ
jgi:hypothetical protein